MKFMHSLFPPFYNCLTIKSYSIAINNKIKVYVTIDCVTYKSCYFLKCTHTMTITVVFNSH